MVTLGGTGVPNMGHTGVSLTVQAGHASVHTHTTIPCQPIITYQVRVLPRAAQPSPTTDLTAARRRGCGPGLASRPPPPKSPHRSGHTPARRRLRPRQAGSSDPAGRGDRPTVPLGQPAGLGSLGPTVWPRRSPCNLGLRGWQPALPSSSLQLETPPATPLVRASSWAPPEHSRPS